MRVKSSQELRAILQYTNHYMITCLDASVRKSNLAENRVYIATPLDEMSANILLDGIESESALDVSSPAE